MKKSKRFVLTVLAVVMIMASIAVPTYSWLSSQSEQVVNTFAGGTIAITLDEAQVDTDGKKIEGGNRVIANSYKYVAGSVLDKDPTATVLKGSVPCYVFIYVENNLNNLFSLDINKNDWNAVADIDTSTLYMYKDIVDAEDADEDVVLTPIFTQVTVSDDLTVADVENLGEKTINATSYAVQSDGLSENDAIKLATEQFIK